MLAIITVVYKNYAVLADFFASLQDQTDRHFHVYVVDLTDHADRDAIIFPDARYTLIKGKNLGYAHGVNLGIDAAHTDGHSLYAIVNPDIVCEGAFVHHAVNALIYHPGTIIGAKIYYAPEYEYHKDKMLHSKFPVPQEISQKGTIPAITYQMSTHAPFTIWYAGGQINWAHATTKHIGVDDLDHEMYSQSDETDFVTGCCMIYDDKVRMLVGTWDTRYFMYYEDTDFCMRAKRAGIKVRYEPSIKLWHKNAQSTGGSGSDFHSKTMEASRVRFGLKYAPLRTKLHLLRNRFFK